MLGVRARSQDERSANGSWRLPTGRFLLPIGASLLVGGGIALVVLIAGILAASLGHWLIALGLLCATLGLVAGVLITRTIAHYSIDVPLDQISTSMEILAARDVMALVDEFVNLAEGDAPGKVEIHATQVGLPPEPGVRRVAEALNATIYRLRAGVYQFEAAAVEPCRRLFYVGADDYLLGGICAEVMAGLLPDGGEVLLVSPDFRHAGVELRRRGFESTIRERFPNLRIVGVLPSVFASINQNLSRTSRLVTTFLRAHPNVVGLYSTEAYGAIGAAGALAGTPLAGKVAVVGHDILDGTVEGLEKGLISAVITQDPFGQGHDTTIHLFNAIAHGWRPAEPRIISGSEIVTKENHHLFWRAYEGVIENPAMRERRPRPFGPARRHLRIAIMGIDDGSFWEPVRHGVAEAIRELQDCNVTVEWIVPGNTHEFNTKARALVVEQLVEEGYDGIATPIYDASLIPYLNRAAERGVAIATLNAEASSLQGLVATLSKERRRLEITAGSLEVAAHHDALTGAYNRMVMDADLAEARGLVAMAGKPSSVIMLDIDHFKSYNDHLGHTAGDEVLRMVAQRIQAEVRPEDRVYRYGGEEFLVLLRDTALDAGSHVAARICNGIAAMALPHEGNQPWNVVTVSAGVSAMEPDGSDLGGVVAAADSALYRSKASGRNTVATALPESNADDTRPASRHGHLRAV
jgi:diguanylate cyclase (GGDEF)-like protein